MFRLVLQSLTPNDDVHPIASNQPLGVECPVFQFVCVASVDMFNLFRDLLAGAAIVVGGFMFGRWLTQAA
jgi:hypothetical protein